MNKLYHGTSDALPVDKYIMPASKTGVLREDWRKKHVNKVFLTDSLKSAEMYAKKAVTKYGGNPVVYECVPCGLYERINTTEYITDRAKVIERK